MRTGLIVSIVAHVAVLTIGLINLGSAEPMTTVENAIVVDLVPVSDFNNIRSGSLDSEVVDTQTPAIARIRPAGRTGPAHRQYRARSGNPVARRYTHAHAGDQ
ncbi:hypothetical protein N8D56_08695 [Devosia sp. A8/3-2]|nr:hypothetical protein N8D56_08695 [Devosia sp. A8/3-2]